VQRYSGGMAVVYQVQRCWWPHLELLQGNPGRRYSLAAWLSCTDSRGIWGSHLELLPEGPGSRSPVGWLPSARLRSADCSPRSPLQAHLGRTAQGGNRGHQEGRVGGRSSAKGKGRGTPRSSGSGIQGEVQRGQDRTPAGLASPRTGELKIPSLVHEACCSVSVGACAGAPVAHLHDAEDVWQTGWRRPCPWGLEGEAEGRGSEKVRVGWQKSVTEWTGGTRTATDLGSENEEREVPEGFEAGPDVCRPRSTKRWWAGAWGLLSLRSTKRW